MFSGKADFLKERKKSFFFYADILIKLGVFNDDVLYSYCEMYKSILDVPFMAKDAYFMRKNFVCPIIFAASGPPSKAQYVAESILEKI